MSAPGDDRQLIADNTWDWALYRLGDGSLLLSVVCGTVAVYEVEVRLGPETTAAYEREGLEAIKRLAAEVVYSPRKWVAAPEAP